MQSSNCTDSNIGFAVPCASYISTHPSSFVNKTYSWSFLIASGYNSLTLPQRVLVSKGSLIQVIENSGKLAIDQSNTKAVYSDLVLSKGVWLNLNSNFNYRFYLNPLTNFKVNRYYFNIVYTYSSLGLYNLRIQFMNSDVSYQQTINITECNHLIF